MYYIYMIFYTLVNLYPTVDKTNVILTTMIIYIIIYIAIAEDYNIIAITTIVVIDYILWEYKFNFNFDLNFKDVYKLFNFNFNFMGKNKEKKTKDKKKHRKVRFSRRNKVRTYDSESYFDPYTNGEQRGFILPQTAQMAQMAPLWGMMTRQPSQYQMDLKKPQENAENVNNTFLIDNRSMAFKEDEYESDAMSFISDASSDLSNSEEEY